MTWITIVIATKDREEHLRDVSLASLAKQIDAPPFDILIWDASTTDASQALAEQYARRHPHLEVRHVKAPRVGLARQRNDAVQQAKGDVVFFIDDDSEVSPDGIRALAELFDQRPEIAGGCLPLDYKFPDGTQPAIHKAKGLLALPVRLYYNIFEPAKKASGYYPPVPPVAGKPINYLFGCDMAFRREVFADHHFEERLQRFSNYVICDDLIFSRVLIQQGKQLAVANRGSVIHHAATGGRFRFGYDIGRVEGYNAGLVWHIAARPWSRWSIIPFLWARSGVLFAAVMQGLRRPTKSDQWSRAAGYLAGLRLFFTEQVFARKGPHQA